MSLSKKYGIERKYISFGKSRSGKKLAGVKFIVSHETANNNADADAHYRYFNRHPLSASAHTFIDDGKILEIIPLDEKAWHVQYQKPIDNQMFGDDANDAAIGVELCRTGDFKKAYDKYVWYHAYLCHKFGLNPSKHIVSHKTLDPQRKYDPDSWLNPNGVTWEQFVQDVVNMYNAWNGKEEIKVSSPNTQIKSETVKKGSSYPLLKKGNKGSHVKLAQQRLIAHGYKLPKYGADSHFGDETLSAVKAFQRDKKLAVDGLIGKNTWSALMNEPVKKTASKATVDLPKGVFRKGSRGNDVKKIQEALNKLYFKCGTADGIYGAKTEDAVRRFQMVHLPYEVDGIYGNNTRNKMLQLLK